MNTKVKNIVLTVVMAVLFIGFFVWNVVAADTEFSDTERRKLAEFPELTIENVISGEFMKEFETYTLDQFPERDAFRGIKAIFSRYVFFNMDNNDVILDSGHISKLEYPIRHDMINHAADRFGYIYDKYIDGKNANVYVSVIPDKNKFLAEDGGYLALDYNEVADIMQERMDYAEYIDVYPLLALDDYYFTDSHWRQEKIVDVAEHIASSMNAPFDTSFETVKVHDNFHGTFYGQAALPVSPESISYLTNEAIKNCTVTAYDDKGFAISVPVYNMENANGKDPYEMFLSGNQAVLQIENPLSENERELVIFRDSFGSSLTPLLIQSYSKITVIDIRYISADAVQFFANFENADVLFIYSTMLLNNSNGLR